MHMTMSQPDTNEIVSVGLDSPQSFATGTSISLREEESRFSFTGFNVQASPEMRLETKALARSIINNNYGEDERQRLLEERQKLIDRKLSGTLSQSDRNRYEYVLWTLDQIEDARHGAALDRLEMSIARYESFMEGVEQLAKDVQRVSLTQRKR
ncbi:hypothetical protein [Caballeronia sp. LjRoot31]|uniref:hypothetical protein n=1 Tax=Caballeronia sp. LjRoot31 TaxID=3342324 RepID=UPI003ECE5822